MPRAASVTRQAERLGDVRRGSASPSSDGSIVEIAAEELLRIEPAEHHLGVGHRRLRAALAVAGRTGHGAGRARTDAERAARIDDRRSSRRPRRSRRCRSSAPAPAGCATSVSRGFLIRSSPSWITLMSAEVPPISMVITFVVLAVARRSSGRRSPRRRGPTAAVRSAGPMTSRSSRCRRSTA